MSNKTPTSDETISKNVDKFNHLLQTPLLAEHLKLGARVVDFGGWALPVNYGSQVDEHHAVRMVRIPFPSFADGRGFSVGKQLRILGYKGRMRAVGHVLSDQFRNALRCGFDEIEIPSELAKRQPEEHWTVVTHDLSYQEHITDAA